MAFNSRKLSSYRKFPDYCEIPEDRRRFRVIELGVCEFHVVGPDYQTWHTTYIRTVAERYAVLLEHALIDGSNDATDRIATGSSRYEDVAAALDDVQIVS